MAKKSKYASEVLQLMDEDVDYCKAVKTVCRRYRINRDVLERELNTYI